jgi:hypothetical protein
MSAKYLVEDFEWPALMGQYGGAPSITSKRGHFYREGADIHSDIQHKSPFECARCPSDRRNLTKNLPLRVQPIIERRPMPIASLAVEFIGPRRDQDMQIVAGGHRLTRTCGSRN